jgi:hypothetical protein
MDQDKDQKQEQKPDEDFGWIRTVIFLAVALPVLAWLLYYAYQKNTESESRAKQCQAQCKERGTNGFQFKWTIMSGPVCDCINE